jgi:hypothetical protein
VLRTSDGEALGAARLHAAAATAGALGPALRSEVDAVIVAADGSVRVRLAAGFSATFGEATELDAKAASLAALLAWVREEDVAIVSADVTVPGSPTARLERGAGAVAVP